MAQRQFRSDDTDQWTYKYGDGSDGDYSSAGNATDAPIDSSCSGTSGTTSLSATNASFTAGQLILIHQTRGTGVGKWELNKIESYTAGTITTTHDLINTYTDSGASQAQVLVLKQYSSFTQNSGHTLTAKAWNGNVGGILAFLCKGTTTITGSLSGNYKGFLGGNGGNADGATSGEGSNAAKTANTSNTGGSGGGGNQDGAGAGGGNGTAGGDGSRTTRGIAVGNTGLTLMDLGGGGGGGSAGSGGGVGGYGGGLFLIISKKIIVTGSLSSNGQNGANSAGRAGGGGAGGSILLKCETATLGTNLITANKGTKGSGGEDTAGDGGVGRIHLDYATSYTGTTTPTIDVTNDTSLKLAVSNFFLMF